MNNFPSLSTSLVLALATTVGAACSTSGSVLDRDAASDTQDVTSDTPLDATSDIATDAATDAPVTDADAGPPSPLLPRLFVANAPTTSGAALGVSVWDHADQLTGDRAPDVQLVSSAHAHTLASDGQRLFVATDEAGGSLDVFDGADRLAAGAMPSVSIPSSVFGATFTQASEISTPGDGSLWMIVGLGDVLAWPDRAHLTATSAPVRFHHMWDQIASAAYDPAGQRLFAGQISGAGALVFVSPLAHTGTVTAFDFQLSTSALWHSIYVPDSSGGRIYAQENAVTDGGSTPYLSIWNGVASITAARAPDVRLTPAIAGTGNIVSLQVADDTLVVTRNYPSHVLLFRNASALAADRAPDVTISDPALIDPVQAVLAHDGSLYVLNRDAVLVFRNATTTPTLAATVRTGIAGAAAIALVQ